MWGRGAGGERGGKTDKLQLSSFVTFCQGDAAYYSCETAGRRGRNKPAIHTHNGAQDTHTCGVTDRLPPKQTQAFSDCRCVS